MIVSIDNIRAAYRRAIGLGASHEEAVATVAVAIGESHETVEAAVAAETEDQS